jgi:tricorn protease-like protein
MSISKLRFLTVSFASYAYIAGATASEAIYPLVTYKCNPEADIITLTNSLLKSDEGAAYTYSDENGTYSPWDLVEIDRRTERTRIVRTKKIVNSCKLSSGEYTITIEPQVFSQNLSGTCGASISSAFTVTLDDHDIQERTPFEDYCRGNSPIITRVTVFGKTGEVKIKRLPRYKFY